MLLQEFTKDCKEKNYDIINIKINYGVKLSFKLDFVIQNLGDELKRGLPVTQNDQLSNHFSCSEHMKGSGTQRIHTRLVLKTLKNKT